MKFKQFLIKDEIYRAHLSLFVGDMVEIKKHLVDNIKIPEERIGSLHNGKFFAYDDYKVIMIPKFEHSTLIHELIHLAFNVMTDRGVPIEYANDETITYYVEMVLNNILSKTKQKIKFVPLKK